MDQYLLAECKILPSCILNELIKDSCTLVSFAFLAVVACRMDFRSTIVSLLKTEILVILMHVIYIYRYGEDQAAYDQPSILLY